MGISNFARLGSCFHNQTPKKYWINSYFLALLRLSATQLYKIRTLSLPVSAPGAFEVTFLELQGRMV